MPRRLSNLLTIPAFAVLSIAAAFAIAGCTVVHNNGSTITIGSAPYTVGSGKVATETRPLTAFHAIAVKNGLSVVVSHGTTASAAVTTDDNLFSLISTGVQNGTLTIDVHGSLTTHNKIEVEITYADALDSIAQSTGSTLDIEDLTGPSLAIWVDTGSTLHAGGKTVALQLTVDTGSTADLRNVESKTAQVVVSTGSTGMINVSETVTGSCHTGSTLLVSGGADVSGVDKDTGSTVSKS